MDLLSNPSVKTVNRVKRRTFDCSCFKHLPDPTESAAQPSFNHSPS